ncbi:NAD(P)-binding protein [Lactarius vividus]|nr:NAD(P)-binding protein [Lactarius vividus]
MSSTTTEPAHPIIIVTGANNGVGFGICRRLLYNLAQNSPDDARPLFPLSVATDVADVAYPCAGLTLIMACRSRQRAEVARTQLLELFENDVEQLQRSTPGGAERVAAFRKNLVVAIHSLDLASVQSTLAFADEVAHTYPYVSHLVCNAGVAPFLRISWPLVFRQFWEDLFQLNLFEFVTHPRYNIQRTGIMSDDGLGWVWQCNVFGHYVICRALEAKFAASQARSGFGLARVVWMSSLETRAEVFDADDWQFVKNDRPYEGTKFQTDLVCAELARRAGSSPTPAVRHITVHPGVVYSLIDAALIGSFSAKFKWVIFYLARWFGSIHHNISTWNGAAAAVHVCLAPLAFIPIFLAATGTPAAKRKEEQVGEQGLFPAQLHSVTDRMGYSSVALSPLYALPKYEKEGEILVDRCERLYQSFLTVGGKPQ